MVKGAMRKMVVALGVVAFGAAAAESPPTRSPEETEARVKKILESRRQQLIGQPQQRETGQALPSQGLGPLPSPAGRADPSKPQPPHEQAAMSSSPAPQSATESPVAATATAVAAYVPLPEETITVRSIKDVGIVASELAAARKRAEAPLVQ